MGLKDIVRCQGFPHVFADTGAPFEVVFEIIEENLHG